VNDATTTTNPEVVVPSDPGPRPSWAARRRAAYRVWTEPASDGLPRARVLLAFPAAVLIVLVVLVALGISGSSTGVAHSWFETGKDHSLIALKPQLIRSDEWIVQTVYTVSQVQEGLPRENAALPGGVDMSILYEAPYKDWSAAFRPHNLGFFFLPFDQAFALKWWLPAAALAIACSLLLTTLWPRRPGAAALVSLAFFFAPFFQWWYLPQTLWPAAWALLVMAATIWITSGRSRVVRWSWAAGTGYVTVTTALGLYAPFLIPALYVAGIFALGWVLRGRRAEITAKLRRLGPLLVAAVGAGLVVGVFLLTRWSTITAFLDTVYPGHRLTATGAGLADPDKEATFVGAFGLALRDGSSYGIRGNSSEASTFVFVGAFLAATCLWLLVVVWRRTRVVDTLLLAPLVCGAIFMAFLYVPGWDAVAHLMLLDRVTPQRLLMGLGLVSLVVIAVVVRSLDELRVRAPWWLAIGLVLVVAGTHVILERVLSNRPAVIAAAGPWYVVALAMAVSVALFSRRRVLGGALAFLVASAMVGGWVNPLYHGVFDLRQTDVARALAAQQATNPGRWVGVGDAMVGPIVTESGVQAFNGFQGAPDAQTWRQVDPHAEQDAVYWNRFANVGWFTDPSLPRVYNPAGDQIRINFDSCAAYEQKNVRNVLSDRPIDQPCVRETGTVTEPIATFHLYEIIPST
jgi:hypothetical protein